MLAEDARFLDQRQKTVTHGTADSMSSMVVSASIAPNPTEMMRMDPSGCYTCRGFATQLRNLKLREPNSFLIGYQEPAEPLSQRETSSLLYQTINRPALCSRKRL